MRPSATLLWALVVFALFAALPSFAQRRFVDGDWGGGPHAWYDSEVKAGFDDTGRAEAVVTITVPYRHLIFLKQADGRFRAAYHLRVVQRDESKKALRSQEWDGEIYVEDYAQTRVSTVLKRELRFALAPSAAKQVLVNVRMDLEGSHRWGKREFTLELPHLPPGGVALGDVALYHPREPGEFATRDTSLIRLAPGQLARDFTRSAYPLFDLSSGEPYALVQVYDFRSSGDRDSLTLGFQIREDRGSGKVHWTKRVRVASQEKERSFLLRLPPGACTRGENLLRITLIGGDERKLEFQNFGLDTNSDKQWEENLRVIEAIANDAELQSLRDTPAGERLAAWSAFWQRRDPDPNTPGNPRLKAHYERVSHARENFKDGTSDGATSDRGRVYVRLGPPDSIESQTMLQSSSAEYELWHYLDRGETYYFRDDDGLGHWALVWREQD